MSDIIWNIEPEQWDAIFELSAQLDNHLISEVDYVDRLRSLGMPAVNKGDILRIVGVKSKIRSFMAAKPLN